MIGRALVTLDLNRDGLQDAVITHLYDPVAALVNQTETESLWIRIFLKGRQCARDAIGAIVSANVNGQDRVLQLTAGDGFQCSNERCLVLGLGTAESATNVTVQWPGGQFQTIGDLPGARDYLVVQGETEPIVMANPDE
jgi:hypothetical protein